MLTSEGNREISVDDYIEYTKTMGFDSFTSFHDEVPLSIGKRRGKQSVLRTKNWLMKHFESSPSALVATIQATENLRLLEDQLSLINQNKDRLLGVNIAGLYLGETAQQRNELLSRIFAALPESLIRFVTGPNSPRDVLEAIAVGSDVSVCSYPIDLAEKAYCSW